MVEKNKPIPIWPLWIFVLLLIIISVLSGSPLLGTGAFWGGIIGAIIIHKKNVKKFGKGYNKKMKEAKKNAIPRT